MSRSNLSELRGNKRLPPPAVQLPLFRLVHDAIFSPGGMPVGSSTAAQEEEKVPDAGAGLLWQTLEVMQAISTGESVNPDLAFNLYQRLASGEYNIVSTRQAVHITERIGAAGHEKDMGAYLAQYLGATNAPRPAPAQAPAPRTEPAPNAVKSSHDSLENADSHLENGSDYDSDDNLSAVRFFPTLLVPEVDKILRTAGSWQFNAFKLKEATNDAPLSTLVFWLLQTSGLVREFDLDGRRLACFLRALESGYSSQSEVLYHSRTHAADVVQGLHVLLTLGGLADLLAATHAGKADVDSQLVLLAAYLAAAMHDVHHMGLTNDFLVRTGHTLAYTYNDMSPNENHHASSALALLRRPENNFLRRMSKKNMAALRKMIIELILATDMQKHVAVHTALQTRLAVVQAVERAPNELKHSMGSADGRSFKERHRSIRMSSLSPPAPTSTAHQVGSSEADRLLLLQGGLKIADLGHLQAAWHVHREWVERLEEEQFRQGDMEKQLRLPVSALMDRTRDGITKMQAGFFDFVALPLLRTWTAICPQAQPALELTEANRQRWIDFSAQPASPSSFASRRSSGSNSAGLPAAPASPKPSLGKWSSTAGNTVPVGLPPPAAADLKAHTLPPEDVDGDSSEGGGPAEGSSDDGELGDVDR